MTEALFEAWLIYSKDLNDVKKSREILEKLKSHYPDDHRFMLMNFAVGNSEHDLKSQSGHWKRWH